MSSVLKQKETIEDRQVKLGLRETDDLFDLTPPVSSFSRHWPVPPVVFYSPKCNVEC